MRREEESSGFETVQVDITTGKAAHSRGEVAREAPISIYVNEAHYATFLATPKLRKELAIGHLVSEGIVNSLRDIKEVREWKYKVEVYLNRKINVELRASKIYRVVSAACGSTEKDFMSLVDRLRFKRVKFDGEVNLKTIVDVFRDVSTRSELYRLTRGVHVAGVYDLSGKLRFFAEDIGRHNAVDKVIGLALLNEFDLGKCMLFCSGRPTSDVVLKTARMSIPFLFSLSMPTEWGVKIALKSGITLGSFKGKLHVFSMPERIEELKERNGNFGND